ncbi:LysR family transcriptional regulator [Escherichia coli]|uniref:LysR family transcriptional regulator n=1 Tax=Escherichia coli TaxID=562 RepID=A0A376LKC2_ECOLX|nr:LysR family transcriptional regulator [Escherichia coli]
MFDPETLRTFIAVAETGSFSKAAERLCKTTATISYRIKLLEENTGVALFFRTTRSVTLTSGWRASTFPGQRLAELAGKYAQRAATGE